jgi:hypothetical protein
VTERDANVGANVDPGTKLLTIVDLSSVWVVGNLYERDFAAVRVGSRATVTTTAYPDLVARGTVSYIDPQVRPETRTAQIRVEVANPQGRLRLGMYADVQIATGGSAPTLHLPKAAVQQVADRPVVYLADPKDRARFVERDVRVGLATGDMAEVLAGLQSGDLVVTSGSFALRAERDRLGLGRPASGAPAVAKSAPSAAPSTPSSIGVARPESAPASGARPPAGQGSAAPSQAARPASSFQTASVTITQIGFEPETLTLRAGVPARITFTRTTENTCGTEVEFPDLDISRALPLNQPVVIELTPKSGELTFACGMNMLRGTIVVR